MFTLINKAPSKKAAKGTKSVVAQVKVSDGIIAQVYPDGAAGAAHEAQIQVTLLGGTSEYRGPVKFSVGEDAYELYKGDTHALWMSHQDEAGRAQLASLFLQLANGKRVVKIVGYEEIGDVAAPDELSA